MSNEGLGVRSEVRGAKLGGLMNDVAIPCSDAYVEVESAPLMAHARMHVCTHDKLAHEVHDLPGWTRSFHW